MPAYVPVPPHVAGDLFTATMWEESLRSNINKLLDRGHRVLTVSQFNSLSALEDGDEVYLEVDAANGVMWHLRYVASEATYKWRYLGGPPLLARVATTESTTSATLVDLATVGPSIIVPRAGEYDIEWGVTAFNTGNSASQAAVVLGASTTNVDLINTILTFTNNSQNTTFQQKGRTSPRAASDELRMRYAVGGNTGTYSSRVLSVKPVRIL